jgi:large subunit ribosomal protein L25
MSCCARLNSAGVSTLSSKRYVSFKVDPSKLVHGVTAELIAKDPVLAEFMEANYREYIIPDTLDQNESGLLLGDTGNDHYTRRQPEVYPRNIRPIYTYLRDPMKEEGSRRCRRMREKGLIPGIVRGCDPQLGILSNRRDTEIFIKTPWKVLIKELDRYHRNFESRVYDLTIYKHESDTEGTVHRVLPQNVNRHPVKTAVFCANFVRYHPGRPISLPFKYVNEEESPALKREGFIVPIQRKVECLVEDGVDIPEFLEIECTGLKYKDIIRLDRLALPDGVRYSKRVIDKQKNFIIGVVFGKSRDADDIETKAE